MLKVIAAAAVIGQIVIIGGPPKPLPPRVEDPADVVAESCSRDDVQAAITSASNGDIVAIPSGECTWTSGVSISGKAVTLRGSGTLATVITHTASGIAIDAGTTASRVTNVSLEVSHTSGVAIRNRGQGFRVDRNRIENGSGANGGCLHSSGGSGIAAPTGVIDQNTLVNCRVLIEGSAQLFTDGDGQHQNNIWKEASTIGSETQTGVVYVENNTITYTIAGNCIDTNRAGRYVFRFNTVTGPTNTEAHSLQSSNERASKSWEIYGNTFTNSGTARFAAMYQRGGTGVIYDNTVSGNYTNAIWFDNYRSFTVVSGNAGGCDGNSSWDGNQTDEEGWPCRDQLGRGPDGSGTFPETTQADEPVYVWDNTINSVAASPVVSNCGNTVKTSGSCADVVLDRDYILSERPGYTPYTHPHPLRGGA